MILMLTAALSIMGCSKSTKSHARPEAKQLYKESVALAKIYIDSIKHAPDSAHVELLRTNYDNAITKLNYKYPPNTYLSISESENEGLARMTGNIIATVHNRLRGLKGHPGLPPDSVAADSTKVIINQPNK